MKFLLICAFVLIYARLGLTSFCYWNSGCPYKCFSSKTPYNTIRGDIRDSAVHIKGCEPISVWVIARHGKRYPGPSFGAFMEKALIIRDYVATSHAAGKCSLCAQDVKNLRNWQVDPKMFKEPYSLTNEGHIEMLELGKRLKEAFPKLLESLEEGSYVIRPISVHWSKNSAKAFAEGFNKTINTKKQESLYDDFAPYIDCKKYQIDVRHNPIIFNEEKKYLHNPEYLATKDRIQRRSGIEYVLTDDNITALYDLCRYDSSGIDNKFSPWCALFTSEDLKVLDYIGDLRHYYRNGYAVSMGEKFDAVSMGEKFGRLPLADLLKTFKQAKEGKGKKLNVYVSQATMMEMIFTALGLFKDEVALSAKHRNPERKWRSCYLSPFSSNVVAVLNRCTKNELDEFNVAFFMNEQPLTVCKSGVCSWDEFEEKTTFHDLSLDFCDT